MVTCAQVQELVKTAVASITAELVSVKGQLASVQDALTAFKLDAAKSREEDRGVWKFTYHNRPIPIINQ
jgi:hypothetical protein